MELVKYTDAVLTFDSFRNLFNSHFKCFKWSIHLHECSILMHASKQYFSQMSQQLEHNGRRSDECRHICICLRNGTRVEREEVYKRKKVNWVSGAGNICRKIEQMRENNAFE